jgi:hypothetical protein
MEIREDAFLQLDAKGTSKQKKTTRKRKKRRETEKGIESVMFILQAYVAGKE